jgi:hypothetical protein
MDCQICFETLPDMYKVTCGSAVDHLICFDCEKKWREKMPIREGVRKMSCPTCRQPETTRTVESLQREVTALYASRQVPTAIDDTMRVILRLSPSSRSFIAHHILSTVQSSTAVAVGAAAAQAVAGGAGVAATEAAAMRAAGLRPSTRPPPRVFCASGRDCFTRSQVNSRTKTHLKCRRCTLVPCCATCFTCMQCPT